MPVDLLHAVPATVAVSSTVANPKYVPAQLVDGDLATAWNSRTGDLVGAWIAVRVPRDVHVASIRMTVGFTHVEGKRDYFVMNPRIRKVRVYRDGALLREQRLDTDSRALQDIAIDADGGDFKIEVAEILPGSKKDWREICVSELEVQGTLAAGAKAAAAQPLVRIGSLDVQPAPPPPAPPQPARVLLALPTSAAVAVVIGDAPQSFTASGAPVVLDTKPPDYNAAPSALDLVAMQPIVADAAQTKAWIGRRLQLEGADGPACTGTISGLAVVGSTPHWSSKAHLDADAFAKVVWADRPHQRMLVAVVSATCSGALWAHDPLMTVTRGKLDAKHHRDLLFDDYFAPDHGYARLNESYMLNDLNGEYEDASANEAKIPEDERLTEKLVRRTFRTYAACASASCVGLVAGEYTSHRVAEVAVIDGDKVTDHHWACGWQIGEPIAAVDVDGDGHVDLLYWITDYVGRTHAGVGYVGRTQTGAVELRGEPCSDRF